MLLLGSALARQGQSTSMLAPHVGCVPMCATSESNTRNIAAREHELQHQKKVYVAIVVRPGRTNPLAVHALFSFVPESLTDQIQGTLVPANRPAAHKEQHANKLGSRSMPLGDAGNGHEVGRTSEACERAMSCAGQWKFCFSHRWPDVST